MNDRVEADSGPDSRQRWDTLHGNPVFAPRYPNEHVIRWVVRQFPRARAGSFELLDAGAGAGRHGMLFARFGYRTTLIDFSEVGMADARMRAQQEGLDVTVAAGRAEALPFAEASFDGVLSYGVLYYLPLSVMRAAIGELYRVLRPGGHALVVIKSSEDSRRHHADPVGGHGYRVREAPAGMAWGNEIGMVLTLLDRPAVLECFAAFSACAIDRSTVTLGGGRYQDEEWLISLTK